MSCILATLYGAHVEVRTKTQQNCKKERNSYSIHIFTSIRKKYAFFSRKYATFSYFFTPFFHFSILFSTVIFAKKTITQANIIKSWTFARGFWNISLQFSAAASFLAVKPTNCSDGARQSRPKIGLTRCAYWKFILSKASWFCLFFPALNLQYLIPFCCNSSVNAGAQSRQLYISLLLVVTKTNHCTQGTLQFYNLCKSREKYKSSWISFSPRIRRQLHNTRFVSICWILLVFCIVWLSFLWSSKTGFKHVRCNLDVCRELMSRLPDFDPSWR